MYCFVCELSHSKSVLKALEKHIPDEDKRVDVALDVCDDILRTLQRRREE